MSPKQGHSDREVYDTVWGGTAQNSVGGEACPKTEWFLRVKLKSMILWLEGNIF